MKPFFYMALVAACMAFASQGYAQDSGPYPAATPVTITVQAGARQTFRGLGVSEFNYGTAGSGTFSQLTSARRALLWRLTYRDLHVKTLRLWYNPALAAPTPGKVDMTGFIQEYVSSGMIADARRNGVTSLLLAPDHVPTYMLSDPASSSSLIRDDQISDYATLLATMIQQVKAQSGVLLNATGIANEPPWFNPAQMVTAVKDLRTELDRRGLSQVMIVAPETSNNDGTADSYLRALKADSMAWHDLEGIATHSYNMASRPEEAAFVAGSGKEFWITEAGGGGLSLPDQEAPNDGMEAASAASRFLNDMNHRVTRWVWFIGAMDVTHYPVDHDNVQRLIEFQPNRPADWYTPLLPYYYLRRISQTFDVGSVFRYSVSSLEGDMTYTYGRKPRLNAAAAKNPDGTWAIGLSNFTGDGFLQDTQLARDNDGYPAQSFLATVTIPELATKGDLTFDIRRNSVSLRDIDEGAAVMHDGKITLSIGPQELVTLRSEKAPR